MNEQKACLCKSLNVNMRQREDNKEEEGRPQRCLVETTSQLSAVVDAVVAMCN